MKPKSRHGDGRGSNLLIIDMEKHNYIHKIFGNHTWYEILLIIVRLAKAKHYENIEPKIEQFYKFV